MKLSSSTRVGKQKVVPPPPVAGAYKALPAEKTKFRDFYHRGETQCNILHCGGAGMNKVQWKCDVLTLDYHKYLPIFLEGIREKEEPFKTLAVQGSKDMILADQGERTYEVLPRLIVPLKAALSTRDKEVIVVTLEILQLLITSDVHGRIGVALVPYYRQLLQVLNLFKNKVRCTYDRIDYGQRRNKDLGVLIDETLELLEKSGGPDAFVNIKYMIPTYQSSV